MARLYWRLKVNGKWTWTPVTVQNSNFVTDQSDIDYFEYLEED